MTKIDTGPRQQEASDFSSLSTSNRMTTSAAESHAALGIGRESTYFKDPNFIPLAVENTARSFALSRELNSEHQADTRIDLSTRGRSAAANNHEFPVNAPSRDGAEPVVVKVFAMNGSAGRYDHSFN